MKTLLLVALLLGVSLASYDNDRYRRWRLRVGADQSSEEDVDADMPEAFRTRPKSYTNEKQSLKNLMKKGFDEWDSYKREHNKMFRSESHEQTRMLAFLSNKQFVERHNEDFARGRSTFEVELNHLTDLPYEEYRKLNGYRRRFGDRSGSNATRFLAPLNVEVPDSVDWRDHGYVTEVKNQGMCGSCWAFSSTGALEGQHKRATGDLVSLSEQNLVDCSRSYGNAGCNGGLMDNAFEYIKKNHGVDTEVSYPYVGRDGKCHFNKRTVGADDKGFVDLPEGDEEKLKIAVATQGPISIAIDAGHRSFQMYKKGVYYDPECSSEDLDHGVLVVGYGTDAEHGDYWIVKNSWGRSWGESGYIRMARNRNNHCGVATKASYPIV
uniref:Cathepsin L-like n=1 Tax=Steinernema glaseri TaxID=37863 RepID=A0A1I7ZU59_9BILA